METATVYRLKTDPKPYEDLVNGHKTHTVRKNDRQFNEGEYIIFKKTKYTGVEMASKDNYPLVYMGVSVLCKITNVYNGPGLADGFVVCSVKILDRFPGRVT